MYEKLGVRPVINAWGTLTYLGGSIMPPEVVEAMDEAAKSFVNMHELLERTGRVVAEATGAEAGLITAGASAALVLATAACITGRDPEKIKAMPYALSFQPEVVIPEMHVTPYAMAFEIAGARLLRVGTKQGWTVQEMENAVTSKTVALTFTLFTGLKGCSLEDIPPVVSLAKRRGIPLIVDAAAELPPEENLRAVVATGADLVAFSGGKEIRGPNDTGLLLGRCDLVEAARMHQCPNYGVGRPMKVSKEQVVGLVTALRLFVERDFKAQRDAWESIVKYWVEQFSGYEGLKAERVMPDPAKHEYYAQGWPKARLTLDEKALGIAATRATELLRSGEPPIYAASHEDTITLSPQCIQPGEERIVAQRLKDILRLGPRT
ncbi:MAG: aminotransferase class V-fold PLP-dependent enzyme [Candidatus Bathyarchaeia archaeon]